MLLLGLAATYGLYRLYDWYGGRASRGRHTLAPVRATATVDRAPVYRAPAVREFLQAPRDEEWASVIDGPTQRRFVAERILVHPPDRSPHTGVFIGCIPAQGSRREHVAAGMCGRG